MNQPLFRRAFAVVGGAAVLLLLGAAGGAVGASLVTSADIKDQTIRARDIAASAVARRHVRDGSLGVADLSTYVQTELAKQGRDGQDGTDGVTGLESDGPRPGATQLSDFPGNGANSTAVWAAGPQKPMYSSWVRCAGGKSAIGGGFSRDAETVAAIKGLQIVTSSPAQIDAEGNVATAPTPITGDAAGSFVPNGWLVEGFNNGSTDLIVRPWVVCAAVS
jgi:hypothetical protein